MTNDKNPAPPPSRHQLALMIWLCVFPTLTVINVTLAGWLAPMPPVLRTFLLATIAVPIVIYGLMPHLHRARSRLLTRVSPRWSGPDALAPVTTAPSSAQATTSRSVDGPAGPR